jgi:hypothetical protein
MLRRLDNMIYYNMRYRGPYEYDKFTLNVLSYVNYVNDYLYDMNNTSEEYDTLKKTINEIDEAFDYCMNNMESFYSKYMINKGGNL